MQALETAVETVLNRRDKERAERARAEVPAQAPSSNWFDRLF
jgi:hypothetical protein